MLISRVILHVDLNSYFATAEQQANPRLRGKPVGIIKARGRTCLIATSIEAKKIGIITGTTLPDAKKLCPQIILVSADFAKYEDISYRFINICKTYSPTCEVFSLDECFIDITETEHLLGGFLNIAFEIKERLRTEIGDYMSCSVGISHNRVLAKLASSRIKCDGLLYIDEASALDFIDKCELRDILGIGNGLYRHLIKIGVDSFLKLRELPMDFLKREFGSFWSMHLYNLARGQDTSTVNSFRAIEAPKSVGRTYTTHRNLYKSDEIMRLIRNLCEEVSAKARKMRMSGRYVGLSLRGGEKSFWGHMTLAEYVDDGKKLFDLCLKISKDWPFFANAHQGKAYVRFCGVTLAMLTRDKNLPIPLFDEEQRREKLLGAVDLVNGKWGDYTLYPAQLLKTDLIRPEVTGYFGDRYYRLNTNGQDYNLQS